jgi:hypothetical protein
MPIELTAIKFSNALKEGFDRLKRYRGARALYIKDYCGQYYNAVRGITGDMPINLIFLALRILVPNLVMKEGVNKITTDILAQKEYADLLGLALDKSQKQRKMRKILRALCVDMCFGMSVAKTSIAASGELIPLGQDVDVDPGQIYTDIVDFDDLSFDPLCKNLSKAAFIGHNVRLPRQVLLDTDGWEHDLVKRLPSATVQPLDTKRVEEITQENTPNLTMGELQDYVNVVESWIPDAESIVYTPNPYQTSFADFLKINDYYGPAEGPYTFGSLTPPVPNNPLPVAPVGVWRDLNDMANKLFKKVMEQADRQKDVLLYDPSLADVADAIREAVDGETIACQDPSRINLVSYGGQNQDNEKMIAQLRMWFNVLAGNPEQMAGIKASTQTGTATEFTGLQANAAVSLEDMRDITYDVAAEISKKEAWYLHTDPLINLPLTKRVTGGQEIQIYLTPEQRQGDWTELTFSIKKRSMIIVEPNLRAKRILEFQTNVIPAVAMAAQAFMQMGIPYNLPRALMQVAEEMGIEDAMSEVFEDPTFQKRMQLFMEMGPKNAGKGQVMSPEGISQNKGSPIAHNILTPGQDFNKDAQQLAGVGQAAFGGMA